jgi:hypothetical protein
MQRLLDRGARGFKFVDRTFNLDLNTSAAILEFFLARDRPGLAGRSGVGEKPPLGAAPLPIAGGRRAVRPRGRARSRSVALGR